MSQNADDNEDAHITDGKAENEVKDDVLPGYKSIEHFTKDGFKILMEAIRHANALPTGRDWNFHKTNESFCSIMNDESASIQSIMNNVLHHYEVKGNFKNRSLEEKTELLIEANDIILENVANNIDEMNGLRKCTADPVLIQTVSAQLPINGSWNRVNNATFSVSSSLTAEGSSRQSNAQAIRLLAAKNIIRPQKFFKDKINNSNNHPWEPRIKDKPNSLKPLAIFLEETENGEEYSHPYEFELERFTPLPEQLKCSEPTVPKPVEKTPLIEIDKPDQLDELVEELRNCDVFAVDLEHHSYRSFMGITCLMQISTRDKDYIIDTLALRDKLWILNEVFTKPSIVKVFHGAHMDIKWLQRDLSIYVVNMFDTHFAAKILEYSGLSLAFLMNKFCNFMPNKQFQLADWRMRPLPEELKTYAREDTHYLIYIYEMLKKELLKQANGQDNLILSVFKQSTELCKQRYFKPVLREDSHMDFYRKCKRLFDNRQLYALRELYKWRDQISREEDESTGYVLPNHMLLQISESIPREMQGILACCNPIPPLVRANLLELHHMILRAREQPLEKAILKEDNRARGTTKKISKVNVDSPLHCPHDLTKTNEFRDDLPTLLNNRNVVTENIEKSLDIEKSLSQYSVFNTPDNTDDEDSSETFKKLTSVKFLGPYTRYKMVKPFIQAEEEKLAAEKAKEGEDKGKNPENSAANSERTDEDRIESIRKHFLQLSKAAPVVQEEQRSLLEMGGSKKRKRDISADGVPDDHEPETDFHSTVPNPFSQNRYGRKRKSSDFNDTSPNKVAKHPPQNSANKNKKFKKKQKKNDKQQQQNQQNPNGNQYQQNNQKVGGGKKNKNQNYQQGNPQNQHQRFDESGRQDYQGNYSGQQSNRGGFNNRNKQRFGCGGQQNEFSPFDYNSVNYEQFQGGGRGAHTPQQVKSNFRQKGKKKNVNRGGNKSFTFGNSRGNTRGRGR